MALYYERDRAAELKPSKKSVRHPVHGDEEYEAFYDDKDADRYFNIGGVGRTPEEVNYDLEGAAISVELFNIQEALRVEELRIAKETEVAELVVKFGEMLEPLAQDGMVIYWEKDFERKAGEAKRYRYAALFSDGLWWITGHHTKGRSTEHMITELIRMKQRPLSVRAAFLGKVLEVNK